MELTERIAGLRNQLLAYVVEQLRVDRATAEDIVHDSVAACLERQDQFQGGSDDAVLYSWLRTTAFRRGLRLIDRTHEATLISSLDTAGSTGTPSEELRFSEARERIHAAVAELPDRQREVITWKYFQNLSTQQIAEHLGITEDAVSGLKSRAFMRLSRQLSPADFESFLR